MPAQSVYLDREIIVSNANISSAAEIVSFTLPSAGIWDIDYFANGTYVSGLAGGYIWLALYDSNNQMVQYSDRKINMGSPISGRYFITTTGPATYKLKTWPDRTMVYRISPNEGRNGVIFSYAPSSPKGDKGDQGIQGPQGLRGIAGPQGIQGAKGDKGDTGARGATGLQGPAGPIGPQGLRGIAGPQGPAGAPGYGAGPLFMAYNGTLRPIPSGEMFVWYPFSGVKANVGNYYNPVTGIFNPKVAGYYQVNGSIFIDAVANPSTANFGYTLGLAKNDITVAQGPMQVTTPTWGSVTNSSFSALVYLNGTTDTIRCKLFTKVTNGSLSVRVSDANYFQAAWIRA